MNFLTDRKRAQGLGAGHSGTHHHWEMMVSSIAIAVLIPISIFMFGSALGGTYEEVIAYYARPFPAIITALTLVVGIFHFMREAQAAAEDYIGGTKRKLTIIVLSFGCYALMAAGLFALIKLAL